MWWRLHQKTTEYFSIVSKTIRDIIASLSSVKNSHLPLTNQMQNDSRSFSFVWPWTFTIAFTFVLSFGFYHHKPKNALRTKTIHSLWPRSSILPFIHHVINNWQFFKCFFNISCYNWRFYSVEFQLSLKKLYKAVTRSICFNWQHFLVIRYT